MENVAKTMQKAVFPQLLAFAKNNAGQLRAYIAGLILFVVGLVISSLVLTVQHPAAGEIIQDALIRAGLLINLALVGFALLLALAFGIKTFSEGVSIQRTEPAQLLLPAQSGISPDVLIIRQAGEDDAAFDARADEAAQHSTATRWVVVIPFQSPVLTIFENGAKVFDRDEPIFALPEWAEQFDGRIAPAGSLFADETPEQYAEYCRKFVSEYREWAPRKKGRNSAGRSHTFVLDIIKNSANILLFLLMSVGLFAQSKTRQVDEALGTRIREIPAVGADVSFSFDINGGIKTFNRTGDGRSTYTDLLKKTPGLKTWNDEGGRLISISRDGEVIAKGPQVEHVNQSPRDRMRPVQAETRVVGNKPFSIPDSASMQDYAQDAKRYIDEGTDLVEDAAITWWEVIMYAFWRWSPLLIIIVGGSWLWAKGGAVEGYWSIHRYAKQILFWVTFTSGTLIAINVLLFFVSIGTPPGVLAFIAAAEFAIAYGVLCWVNPDYRPKRGNDPEQGIVTTFANRLNRGE